MTASGYRVEQPAPFTALEHRRLAGPHHMRRPAHRRGRVRPDDLVHHRDVIMREIGRRRGTSFRLRRTASFAIFCSIFSSDLAVRLSTKLRTSRPSLAYCPTTIFRLAVLDRFAPCQRPPARCQHWLAPPGNGRGRCKRRRPRNAWVTGARSDRDINDRHSLSIARFRRLSSTPSGLR